MRHVAFSILCSALVQAAPLDTTLTIEGEVGILRSEVTPGLSYILEGKTNLDDTAWTNLGLIRPTNSQIDRAVFSADEMMPPASLPEIELTIHTITSGGSIMRWQSLENGRTIFTRLPIRRLDARVPDGYRLASANFTFVFRHGGSLTAGPADSQLSAVEVAALGQIKDALDAITLDLIDDELSTSAPPQLGPSQDANHRFFRLNTIFSDIDWDNDGLSNTVELNQHNTDPFLSDSDFDGYSDTLEVLDGNRSPLVNELLASPTVYPPQLPSGLTLYYEFENLSSDATGSYFANRLGTAFFRARTVASTQSASDGTTHRSAAISSPSQRLFVTDFAQFSGFNSRFCISMWIKTTPGALNQPGIRGLFGMASGNGFSQLSVSVFSPFADGSQTMRLVAVDGNPQIADIFVSNTFVDFDDGEWHHFLLNRDNGYSIYIDGQFLGNYTGNNGFLNAPRLVLGGSSFSTTLLDSLSGNIDRVMVWNRALTPSEILTVSGWDKADTDRDGVTDEQETTQGTNPLVFDAL